MISKSLGALAALAALGGGAAQAASPVAGMWNAPVDHATIEIYDCGASTVCGKVVDSDPIRANPDLRDTKNPNPSLSVRHMKGLVMMTGFQGGPTEWKGGQLYDPADGHIYHGTIKLVDGHTLKLAGCIFGPLCSTQVWTRAQ